MNEHTEKSSILHNVSAKSIASYALLPGIFPRLRGLSRAIDGFLFMFTQLFAATGLIDKSHPCLQPANIGRYRFFNIIGLAASNVVFDKKHLPQTLMFFAIVSTFLLSLMTAAVGLALIILHIPDAHAQYFSDSSDGNYYKTQDWAYQFLGEVFGPVTPSTLWGGVWDSATKPPEQMIFTPMLVHMFTVYSQALLVIAAFMVIYLIITMVADAARTGQPFGSNFNSVWAPIRLAIAIGLLVPIAGVRGVDGGGYNGAQLIAMQTANWGSALATNVWIAALQKISPKSLIARSQPDNGYRFMRGLFLMEVCKQAVINRQMAGGLYGTMVVKDRIVKSGSNGKFERHDMAVIGGKDGLIGGAVLNSDYCGTYQVPVPQKPKAVGIEGVEERVKIGKTETLQVKDPATLGALPQLMTQQYVSAVNQMRAILNGGVDDPYAAQAGPVKELVEARMCEKDKNVTDFAYDPAGANVANLHAKLITAWRNSLGYKCEAGATSPSDCTYLNDVGANFSGAATADSNALSAIMNSGKHYGWASAGSFMLLLAYANNMMSSAVNSPPQVLGMPRPFTNPVASPSRRNSTVDDTGFFEGAMNWLFGQNSRKDEVAKINKILWEANTWFVDWPSDPKSEGPGGIQSSLATKVDLAQWRGDLNDQSQKETFNGGGQANPLEGVFGSLMRSFIVVNQADVDPLAKVVSIGSGLFYAAAGISIAGLIANFWLPGTLSLALSLALPLTISAYLLAVVLPATLFFNFLFAVIEWVVSVFEAVLGMPLWALSFISLGGDGIGDKAMSGVMMLFEIMLRPTIIVIVTVASFIIFSAAVHFFNKAFGLYYRTYMMDPDMGAGLLMSIGSIFMYVMSVHSIGNSCFKLIPTVANNFMRWIGGPSGFSGTMQMDIEKVSGLAGLLTAQKITDSIGGFAGGQLDKGYGQPAQNARTVRRHQNAVNKANAGQSLSRREQRRVDAMEEMGGGPGRGNAGVQALRNKLTQRDAGV